jgi:hypothetical protein
MSDRIGNGQRAVWVFLFYTLVGPFFGGLAVAAALIAAPPLGLAGVLPPNLPPLGAAVILAYVWCAVPSGLAALGLIPLVLRRGQFGLIEAAAAGVIAFAAAAQLFPLPIQGGMAGLAFLAGLVSVMLRAVLERGDILAVRSAD